MLIFFYVSHSEDKDSGNEKVKVQEKEIRISPEKVVEKKEMEKYKPIRKFRVQVGYSDSEGSDYSEIAGIPISNRTLQSLDVAKEIKPSTSDKPDNPVVKQPSSDYDDFFDD